MIHPLVVNQARNQHRGRFMLHRIASHRTAFNWPESLSRSSLVLSQSGPEQTRASQGKPGQHRSRAASGVLEAGWVHSVDTEAEKTRDDQAQSLTPSTTLTFPLPAGDSLAAGRLSLVHTSLRKATRSTRQRSALVLFNIHTRYGLPLAARAVRYKRSHQSQQLNSTRRTDRRTHAVPGSRYAPTSCPADSPSKAQTNQPWPSHPSWSDLGAKGPGSCSLALPLDDPVRIGAARYRSSNGTDEKLPAPASQPSRATSSPQSLPAAPSAVAEAAAAARQAPVQPRARKSKERKRSAALFCPAKPSLARACPVSCPASSPRSLLDL
ncbi:hypothetical protein CORC01_04181 [Colletotrichum orchidophilum]|uniref:Uncharacterized protein n=1 Tax=Colletotrichum orchidophilum TaxID=1209926 RepID=A0A1G4BGC4_9PEZI|nr:uncharacterized protein CORC01_04181 [Colletotrichum orchidophilum]OHF00431.1 hypothetical protein CORC01_04181 [Colletotrichum orchidophilum]